MTSRAELDELQARRYDDVVLVPAELGMDWKLGCRLGAYDGNGQPVDDVLVERYTFRCPRAPISAPIGPSVPNAVYGGFLVPHFGHFLLETLARLWWIRDHPAEQVIWHGVNSDKLSRWQVEIFELFGLVVSPSAIVLEPVEVGRLTIPQPGFVIGRSFHPAQADALGVVPFPEPTPGRHVWLSRSSFPGRRGKVVGEAEFEERLSALGWDILAPETLTIPEQLERLSRAETIGGFEGSGFHLLILGRDVRAKVRIIHRGRRVLSPNYDLVATTKAFDQKSLYVEMYETSGMPGARTLRARDHDQILRFLGS